VPSLRVPVAWLREYVDVKDVDEVALRLHMSGSEVDRVERTGGAWGDKVHVARIAGLEKHPNADKLQLASVEYGQGRTKTVVTGAMNIAVGDIVPYAEAGASLIDGHTGEPFILKPKPMRGIASEGMVLSAKELGLGEDHEGILQLERSLEVGALLRDAIGEATIVLEIAPNRPDTLSVMGIAREISALYDQQLRQPASATLDGDLGSGLLTVRVEDATGCPRFAAAYLEDVRIAPSPDWLKHRLLAAGMGRTMTPTVFLAAKAALGGAGALLGFLFGVSYGPLGAIGLAGAFAAGGFTLPGVYVSGKARRRRDEIRSELPDALDLLAVSVEAGLGFDGAVAKLTEHMEGSLAEEFSLTLGQMRIGESRSDALKGLAERERIREAFGTYLDKEVAEFGEALRCPDSGAPVEKSASADDLQGRHLRRHNALLGAEASGCRCNGAFLGHGQEPPDTPGTLQAPQSQGERRRNIGQQDQRRAAQMIVGLVEEALAQWCQALALMGPGVADDQGCATVTFQPRQL